MGHNRDSDAAIVMNDAGYWHGLCFFSAWGSKDQVNELI